MNYFRPPSQGGRPPSPSRMPDPGASGHRARPPRATKVILVGRLVTEAGDCIGRVLNISVGGMMVTSALTLQPRQQIRMELRGGKVLAGTVMWAEPPRAGVQFDTPFTDGLMSLMPPPDANSSSPRGPRFAASAPLLIRDSGSNLLPGTLLDISQYGAKVKLEGALTPGTQVAASVPGLPAVQGSVRWSRDDEAGIAFLALVPYDDFGAWLQDPAKRYGG